MEFETPKTIYSRDGRTAVARDMAELYQAQEAGWSETPAPWASVSGFAWSPTPASPPAAQGVGHLTFQQALQADKTPRKKGA